VARLGVYPETGDDKVSLPMFEVEVEDGEDHLLV
jgi:hypothetical protein